MVGKYQRFTSRVVLSVLERLQMRLSMKDIALQTGTSVGCVVRCQEPQPQTPPRRLPAVLALGECKGNAGGEKFPCILTAPQHRQVLDILPSRNVSTVQDYLKSFPNRVDGKFVVMDLHRGFRNVARTFLPNAKIVIDRFRVVRCCTWAMDDVRRKLQPSLAPETRKHFKRTRRLLLAHRDKLCEENRFDVSRMLRFSDDLHQAYALKEHFYHLMDSYNSAVAAHRLHDRLEAERRLAIPAFIACARLLRNWRPYILNVFDFPYSNAALILLAANRYPHI